MTTIHTFVNLHTVACQCTFTGNSIETHLKTSLLAHLTLEMLFLHTVMVTDHEVEPE